MELLARSPSLVFNCLSLFNAVGGALCSNVIFRFIALHLFYSPVLFISIYIYIYSVFYVLSMGQEPEIKTLLLILKQ